MPSFLIVSAVMPRSLQHPLRLSAGRRRQLRLEIFGGALVRLQERFALGRVRVRVAAADLLGKRHAELRGEMLDGVDEAELFLQLEKLEDVAADAAAEAVEKAFVAVDVKRRALFGVKRAEALVGGPGFSERHILLHDLQDIGLHAQVVDE